VLTIPTSELVIEKKVCLGHTYSRFMIFYVYVHTSLIGLNLNWLLTSLCFKTLYLYFVYWCRNSRKRIFTSWCVQTMFWSTVPYSGQNMQQNLLNVSHIGLHTNTTLLERKQWNDYLKVWSEKCAYDLLKQACTCLLVASSLPTNTSNESRCLRVRSR